ncbi:unnamed protein product [Porites lobata]|uniref:Death domain-containing protein n=1 Tax=Porites lobata TaxID=104759 RepID=A0ABN8NDS7_9CNID|nr:unnamed protein product [Porites lobata]
MASDAPEGGGSNAALLDVSFGWPFNFRLRINDPDTVRSLSSKVANALGFGLVATGIGIGALCYKHPEFVMGIVQRVFTAPGLEVGSVTPGSVLVELHCNSEKSFRSFMEDFEARKVQERLNKEFENSGYIGEELEMTITNYKEAEKFLEQFSRQPESSERDFRQREVFFYRDVTVAGSKETVERYFPEAISSSTAAKRKGELLSPEPLPKRGKSSASSLAEESVATTSRTADETKFRNTASNPPEVTVTMLTNRKLPKTSERLDREQLPIDILLLTVKDCEFLACLSFLTGFSRMFQKGLGDVYIGNIGEMKIAVMKCKMGAAGPGGAAGVVRDAVKALTPKAVFCVGYCGGLQPVKVKLGDVVISEVLITYAPSKVTKDDIEERGHRVPLKPDLALVILNAAAGWSPPLWDPAELEVERVKRGALLSGPYDIDNNDVRKALLNRFPGAIAIEMEGEGVYSAAHDLNVEWIIIKGVSDFADGKESDTDAWRSFASLMAASFVAHILSNPIIFEDWPHYNKGQTNLPPSSVQGESGEHVERKGSESEAQSKGKKKPVSSGKVSIKDGTLTKDELEALSLKLGSSWQVLARRLEFNEAEITAFHKENEEYSMKAYKMLIRWKEDNTSKATYKVMYNALCHNFVKRRDLAEEFCCDLK